MRTLKDLFYAPTEEFYKATRLPKYETCREIDPEVWDNVMNIIGAVVKTSSNSFYGFYLMPFGVANAVLIFRLGHFAPDSFRELLQKCHSINVTPIDDSFVINIVVENLFVKDKSSETIFS